MLLNKSQTENDYMWKPMRYFFIAFIMILMVGCTTSQVAKTVNVVGTLFGGVPERKDLLENNVREELEYHFRECMGTKNVNDPELTAKCVEIAYANTKAIKGIDKDPVAEGTVTVEQESAEINEDEKADEDIEKENKEGQ